MIDSSKVSSPILVILLSMQWGSAIFLNRKELVFDVVLIDIFLSRCFWNLISYIFRLSLPFFLLFWLISTSTTNLFPGSLYQITIHARHLIEFDQKVRRRFDGKFKFLPVYFEIWFLLFDWWREVPPIHFQIPKGYFRGVFVIWQFMLDI